MRVAKASALLGLRHVVVTSVNRDDLDDEGSGHFVEVIRRLKELARPPIVEILTPDFKKRQAEAVERIVKAGPDIFSHNVETVPRLYRKVRPQADYPTSLRIFTRIKASSDKVLTKSGLMLGLGETREEVLEVLRDLRHFGCEMLTLGQYLQSSTLGLPVEEYINPAVFEEYKKEALAIGFSWVESGPFVRSSYHAKGSFEALKETLTGRGAINRARTGD